MFRQLEESFNKISINQTGEDEYAVDFIDPGMQFLTKKELVNLAITIMQITSEVYND